MNTPLDELRKSDLPLIAEVVGPALGVAPAVVRRIVKEWVMPCSFFVPAYSLPQVRAIILKLQTEQIESPKTSNRKARTMKPRVQSYPPNKIVNLESQIEAAEAEAQKMLDYWLAIDAQPEASA